MAAIDKDDPEDGLNKMLAMTSANPDALLGFITSDYMKGNNYEVIPLRALFNFAAKPIPKDLQEQRDGTYKISRAKVAGLVYSAARNNGYSRVDSTKLWLKARRIFPVYRKPNGKISIYKP